MPNAGKSTLLSRLSRARPQIADYPFTTKHPNLGLVQANLDRSYVIADIPGLIEGAHRGVGLGHEFLRHVERTRLLVHLVEPAPLDESDPIENYHRIRTELAEYDVQLAARPEIVAVTKAELPGATEVYERLRAEISSAPAAGPGDEGVQPTLLLISAVTGEGLNALQAAILKQLDDGHDW